MNHKALPFVWRLAVGLTAAITLVGCAAVEPTPSAQPAPAAQQANRGTQATGSSAQPEQALPPQMAVPGSPPPGAAAGVTDGVRVNPAAGTASPGSSAPATTPPAPAAQQANPGSQAAGSSAQQEQALPPQMAVAGSPKPTPSASASISAVEPPQQTAQPAADPANSAVRISIIGDNEKGMILESTTIDFKEGDSVFDVLQRITKQKKIQMEHRGSVKIAYVEGIDNLYEFDKGGKSGWLYRVNGIFPNKSAGAYVLQKGDRIEWVYTLDMGKDVGKSENLKADANSVNGTGANTP